ncbi:MAG: universal stress protein [Myxococcota bacterium]
MNQRDTSSETPFVLVGGILIDETGPVVLRRIERAAFNHPSFAVHLCHVLAATPSDETGAEKAIEKQLEQVKNWARAYVSEALAAHATMHVAVGAVDDALLRLADDVEASAIVVGVHLDPVSERLTVGPNGRRLVERAACPVVFATPEATQEKTSGATPGRVPGAGRYHYRRTFSLAANQSTVGVGGSPLRP